MTQTYRISPLTAEQDTNRILIRSLSFGVFVMMISLFIVLLTGQFSQPRQLMTLLAGFALLIAFVIWRTIRRFRRTVKNGVETYELRIDDLQITRTQRGFPTIVIPRTEVKRLSEREGQGFKIETAQWRQCIWVPRELEKYEEVKALLLSSTPEKLTTTRHPLVINYGASLICLAGLLTVFYSQRRSLVTTVGAAVLCFYAYYVFQVIRTWPNLSRSMKRTLAIMIFPALGVVARIASVWR